LIEKTIVIWYNKSGDNMYLEELYLFCGTEQVIKKNKIDRLLENVNEEDTDIIKYDLELTPIQEVVTDCLTIPFLKKNKVIICKNPVFFTNAKSSVKHDVKPLIKYLVHPNDTTSLIIDAVGINIDKNTELYKSFQKYAYIIDVKDLDDVETKAWIKRNIELMGSSIGDEALNLLVDFLGDDLLRAEKEIEKLATLRKNDRITEKDIKELVARNYDNDAFLLIRAVISKNHAKVLEYYNNLASNINNTSFILNMISKNISDLYIAIKLDNAGYSQKDIGNILKVKPGRVYYMLKEAKELSVNTLENYINEIVKLDYRVKNGLIDKNFGLEMFLLKL